MSGKRMISSDIPLRWILFWLILPNLAVILLWPVVGVPMQAGLIMSCILALIASQLPWRWARAVGVICATALVTILYICHLFAIPPLNFGLLLQFLSDVRPLNSPEYTAAAIIMAIVLALAVYFAPRVPRFSSRKQYLYAALAIGLLINLDGALASDQRKAGRDLPPPGTPIDSAMIQAGISPASSPDRHLLLIVVEALGVPVTQPEQALFDNVWNRPEWKARYDVTTGSNAYYGSTTNGELRELCGAWAHYTSFDFVDADCLPDQFRKAGYETTAVHAFVGDLFGRTEWYPQLGFDKSVFAETLYGAGAQECPGVFPGACDTDVPAYLLDELASARKPQFIYWLTLNTHVPVVADENMGTRDCTMGDATWRDEFPALCRLFQLHAHLSDSLTDMLESDRMPPTDILIVGDHKPPLFDRASNARFESGRVPWIYLRAKSAGIVNPARVAHSD